MMNLVVAPIIQNHGDHTCPSQTDQLILFSLLALHMISRLNAVANFLKNSRNILDYVSHSAAADSLDTKISLGTGALLHNRNTLLV